MRTRLLGLLVLLIFVTLPSNARAFWVWTPESNKWENPKFAVKDTPQDQLSYAQSLYQDKKYEEAIREFRKLIKTYPKAREAAEAQFYLGQCREDQGKLFEAYKEYQLVIDKYPFSERGADVIQKEFDLGVKYLENISARSKFVDAVSGTEYNVIDIFRTVIKNAPYGKLAPQAQYKIGLYLLEKQLFQEARDEFEKVVNDYPESEWARAAKYQIAIADSKRSSKAQYDQKTTQVAVQEFKKLVEAHPDADLSEHAKDQIRELRDKEAHNVFLVAEFYEKQKNYEAAKIYYQSLVDDYINTRWATKALEKIRILGQKTK